MTGDNDGPSRGIIPRSVEQIIDQVIHMRSEGWEVSVSTSMVELYNEELRDLLVTGVTPQSTSTADTTRDKDRDRDPRGDNKVKLKISNLQGYVTVAGLTSVELDTSDLRSGMRKLDQLLDRSSRARATACTAMNERSSRSHALFMLDITARHVEGGTVLRGGLRLCDLAGSERLDRTGTGGDAARLKETVNINKSLSCLADVFLALSNKAQHVPYRNSKLTMLLQVHTYIRTYVRTYIHTYCMGDCACVLNNQCGTTTIAPQLALCTSSLLTASFHPCSPFISTIRTVCRAMVRP
jgi:kinesin family protein C1